MRRAVTIVAGVALTHVVGCGFFSSGKDSDRPAPWFAERRFERRESNSSTPEQDAIIRVLDGNQEHLTTAFAALARTSQPSAVAVLAREYADHISAGDLAGCPAEFRAAVGRHAQAWKQLAATLARFPDAYEGSEFMTNLGFLFHGDEARGRSLGGDLIAAVGQVNHTYGEQFTAAEGYGIVAHKSD